MYVSCHFCTGESNLDGVRAISWGRENEAAARNAFEAKYNTKVLPCGLFLSADGLLGASPDGVLDDVSIVEIKCPYKWRNISIKDACKYMDFFLSDSDGDLSLKRNTNYYHQVQGQLFLSGRSVCFFIIWNPIDFVCIPVRKDPQWSSNLQLLRQFAVDHYLPHLLRDINQLL